MQNRSLSIKDLRVAAFDWDNTLAYSREALVFSINKVLPLYGLPCWDIVKTLRDRNLSFRDNFPRIFGDKAHEAYEKYRIIYKENDKNFLQKPADAVNVLNFLQQNHTKIVIVTNKDRELFDFELPFLYAPSLFTKIICGHEALKDKPDAEQLKFTVTGLVDKITPQTVWMIGDSPMDSACALSAGAKAIRIGQPIWEAPNDVENPKILFIDNFTALYDLLQEQ